MGTKEKEWKLRLVEALLIVASIIVSMNPKYASLLSLPLVMFFVSGITYFMIASNDNFERLGGSYIYANTLLLSFSFSMILMIAVVLNIAFPVARFIIGLVYLSSVTAGLYLALIDKGESNRIRENTLNLRKRLKNYVSDHPMLNTLKKPVIYFVLFILAAIIAQPLSLLIHERGHALAAQDYGWNYTTNLSKGEMHLTKDISIIYIAPTSVNVIAKNATREQKFSFYTKPLIDGFTLPAILLFITILIPAKHKNRYVEVLVAFTALWLVFFATEYALTFQDGSDMWKLSHLFAG